MSVQNMGACVQTPGRFVSILILIACSTSAVLLTCAVVVVCFQVGVGELLDTFSRRQRPPFCWTACERRMSRESESGLAALRLTSSSRGMTALWCSLWLSFLLPLCVAPARLPTAQPTGRTHDRTSYTLLIPLLTQHGR